MTPILWSFVIVQNKNTVVAARTADVVLVRFDRERGVPNLGTRAERTVQRQTTT
jgi:hypothetical protein